MPLNGIVSADCDSVGICRKLWDRRPGGGVHRVCCVGHGWNGRLSRNGIHKNPLTDHAFTPLDGTPAIRHLQSGRYLSKRCVPKGIASLRPLMEQRYLAERFHSFASASAATFSAWSFIGFPSTYEERGSVRSNSIRRLAAPSCVTAVIA